MERIGPHGRPRAEAEELKINFIGAVFRIAQLNVKGGLKTFFERAISGIVQGKKISVIVDCMVASPRKSGNPQAPYFFLQERFAARFKQAQRFGKTDGSGRPPTRPNVGGNATCSQRRTANKSIMIKNHYMAAM